MFYVHLSLSGSKFHKETTSKQWFNRIFHVFVEKIFARKGFSTYFICSCWLLHDFLRHFNIRWWGLSSCILCINIIQDFESQIKRLSFRIPVSGDTFLLVSLNTVAAVVEKKQEDFCTQWKRKILTIPRKMRHKKVGGQKKKSITSENYYQMTLKAKSPKMPHLQHQKLRNVYLCSCSLETSSSCICWSLSLYCWTENLWMSNSLFRAAAFFSSSWWRLNCRRSGQVSRLL